VRKLDNETISMIKYWTAEKQVENLTKCQQLFGGYGYMEEYPIANAWAQARVDPIHGGTSEIMKEIISRRI
jgi:alkylation response protein AidB-like acyl-CoA dehydrogenase